MTPILCTCLNVSEAEVRAAVEAGASSVADVGERCEAGTGCTSCHDAIRFMLEAHARDELAQDRAPRSLTQLRLFEGPPKSAPAGAHNKKPR